MEKVKPWIYFCSICFITQQKKALIGCEWLWYVGSFSVHSSLALFSAFERCETSHVRLVQWNSQKTWRWRSILQSNQRGVPLVQQTFRDGQLVNPNYPWWDANHYHWDAYHCMIPIPSCSLWVFDADHLPHTRQENNVRKGYQKHLAE